MFQLKSITQEGIALALIRAERYRMLNEPRLAESICEDILIAEPSNQQAITNMLLCITDQMGRYRMDYGAKVRELIGLMKSDYDKNYYSGMVCERQAVALIMQNYSGGNYTAFEWLQEAMGHYEKAESMRPLGNDDAILRWNTCARLIKDYELSPGEDDHHASMMELG